MKINPLGNRILLKYIQKEEKTKEGIIIPDTAEENPIDLPDRGKIVRLGKEVNKKEFSIGDKVFFNRIESIKVCVSGKDTKDAKEIKYMIINEDKILGKIVE